MKQILLFICLSIYWRSQAQNPGQNWPLGIVEFPELATDGNAVIRFLPNQTIIEKVSWHMNFESTVGAASDSSGALILMTNGCYLADGNGDTLLNGDGLNPGLVSDWVCAQNGYPSPRGAMILPQPGHPDRYYLFHNGVRYGAGEGLKLGPFYYSVVDMTANGGKGAVIEKNKILAEGDVEPFSAVRHGNGRDWWLMVPQAGSNKYFLYLFSPSGVSPLPVQILGPSGNCKHTGSTVFAPDGSRFARQLRCRTIVFHFDRCTGLLSDPVAFEQSHTAFGGGGVGFSADGSRLFVSAHLAIFTADLKAVQPTLDTLVPIEKTAGAGLQWMQQAPDGSFYFNLSHRSKFLPKFTYSGNGSFNYLQQGLTLPVYSVKSLPNFPNFNLFDFPGSPCDTLGISPVRETNITIPVVRTFPNPVAAGWQIDVSDAPQFEGGILTIYDIYGHLMITPKQIFLAEGIDIAAWPDGMYCWKIATPSGNWTGGYFEKQ